MLLSNAIDIFQNRSQIQKRFHMLNEAYASSILNGLEQKFDKEFHDVRFVPEFEKLPDDFLYKDRSYIPTSRYVGDDDMYSLTTYYRELFKNVNLGDPAVQDQINSYDFRFTVQGRPKIVRNNKFNTFGKLLRYVSENIYINDRRLNIEVDKVPNEQIEVIPVKKARSKDYANYLLIWLDNDGKIMAISFQHKILVYFSVSYKHAILPNKDYVPEDLIQYIDAPVTEIDEWVHRIYSIYPIYEASFGTDSAFKHTSKLKSTSTINLVDKAGTIFGINVEVLANDYQVSAEKIKDRHEWAELLQLQKHQASENIRKYRLQKKQNVLNREQFEVEKYCNNLVSILTSVSDRFYAIQSKLILDLPKDLMNVKYSLNNYGELFSEINTWLNKLLNYAVRLQAAIIAIYANENVADNLSELTSMVCNINYELKNAKRYPLNTHMEKLLFMLDKLGYNASFITDEITDDLLFDDDKIKSLRGY